MLVALSGRILLVVCLATIAAVVPAAQGALIMKMDLDNDLFFMEGSDTGNAADFGFGSYDLQFLHQFPAQPTATSAVISSAPQTLFLQNSLFFGSMNLIRTVSSPYVFIDLASSLDITALSGAGPSAAISYAGLSESDKALFESLVGQSMDLTIGSGYEPIAVEAIPEPGTLALLTVGIACLFFWRRCHG